MVTPAMIIGLELECRKFRYEDNIAEYVVLITYKTHAVVTNAMNDDKSNTF